APIKPTPPTKMTQNLPAKTNRRTTLLGLRFPFCSSMHHALGKVDTVPSQRQDGPGSRSRIDAEKNEPGKMWNSASSPKQSGNFGTGQPTFPRRKLLRQHDDRHRG